MKISYNWLKKHIEIQESPVEIATILTNTGLEVEKTEIFETLKGGLKGFVIGRVLTCERHPDADKLKKTTVSIGNHEILPIVCGAPNVAEGQKVIVATVGTTIYPKQGESFVIKKAKIRGEVSEGMICAEDEIGIGESHDGILVIETNLPEGTPASAYFNIHTDYIFEIGLTPNRADAASHLGVARDLKAFFRKEILIIHTQEVMTSSDRPLEVVVDNHKACPRYAGISFENVSIQDSPAWLQQALRSIGLSPINNLVDITNFILHDMGQPLHAFDQDKIAGNKIVVKNISEGTEFITLDGITRKIKDTDLMICDRDQPMAIAGVFGGKFSGVNKETTRVFLESAYFSPESVRKTSLNHGLKTETSFRFERGTDPNMPIIALNKATAMIIEICGAKISSSIIDIYPQPIANVSINVSLSRIRKLIGKAIEKEVILSILHHLDIRITEDSEDILHLSVPPYRVDVLRESDIVEEILRIYGLNNIHLSERVSTAFIAEFPKKDKDKIKAIISSLLVAKGFFEIITNSLTRGTYAQSIGQGDQSVKILNPLSEVLDAMRQSLVFSGLEILSHNINRQHKDLKLFEFGKTYNKYSSGYVEQNRLGLFICGYREAENFDTLRKEVDFQYLKAIVDIILKKLGLTKAVWEVNSNELIREGMEIKVKGKSLVHFGLIKDQVTKNFDIRQKVFVADFDIDLLVKLYNQEISFTEVPKFPEVRRDLSLVLDRNITFQQVNELALKIEKKLLKQLNVFDIYEGDKIASDKKSYAVSFILQDAEQTLTDKVIDQTMTKLIDSFEKELGAVIRNKN